MNNRQLVRTICKSFIFLLSIWSGYSLAAEGSRELIPRTARYQQMGPSELRNEIVRNVAELAAEEMDYQEGSAELCPYVQRKTIKWLAGWFCAEQFAIRSVVPFEEQAARYLLFAAGVVSVRFLQQLVEPASFTEKRIHIKSLKQALREKEKQD